jgi:hypothetical protein
MFPFTKDVLNTGLSSSWKEKNGETDPSRQVTQNVGRSELPLALSTFRNLSGEAFVAHREEHNPLDEADNGGNKCSAEQEVKNALARTSKVKFVYP